MFLTLIEKYIIFLAFAFMFYKGNREAKARCPQAFLPELTRSRPGAPLTLKILGKRVFFAPGLLLIREVF